MDLVCYLTTDHAPLIRPAPATRQWMDEAVPDSYAYRCLPLNIANGHGWEILNPGGFEAVWDGSTHVEGVTIIPDPGAETVAAAVFGQGVLTFHVHGLIRTPPGWDLWIGGSPNRFKDGIAPLTGMFEADWSPYSFTMNWRFTRPHTPVRFEAMEPFCFIFPVPRGAVEAFEPRYRPLESDSDTYRRYHDWKRERDAMRERMRLAPPSAAADQWSKRYYRGIDITGQSLIDDHRAKLRVQPFSNAETPAAPEPPAKDSFVARPPNLDEADRLSRALARRDWLLQQAERQRDLAPVIAQLDRKVTISPEAFLADHYAASRPVILTGQAADWPSLTRWTPDYLKARLETAVALREDMHPVASILQPDAEATIQIAGAGTLMPLRQSLANTLIVQAHGRSRVKILPASEIGFLHEKGDGSAVVDDLDDAEQTAPFAGLVRARHYDFVLEAGDALFLPLGWWRQARAETFGADVSFTAFRWPNAAAQTFPAG